MKTRRKQKKIKKTRKEKGKRREYKKEAGITWE